MKCWFMMAFAVSVLMQSGSTSFASDCAVDAYDHNGSTMEVQICDGEIFITYSAPRTGLAKLGIAPGTLLLNGRTSRSGDVAGEARLFSAKCGEITYAVEGRFGRTGLVLTGQAPRRDASCRVTSFRDDELLFTEILVTAPSVPRPPSSRLQSPSGATPLPRPPKPSGALPLPPPPTASAMPPKPSLPTPAIAPAPTGDWYAISGAYRDSPSAQKRADDLNGRQQNWFAKNTQDCPNFTNGYWITAIGPLSKAEADTWRERTGQSDAYIKTCH